MKRLIDIIMAGAGLGLMFLATAIKLQKFGGDRFDLTSGQTTMMLLGGIVLFLIASMAVRRDR